MKAILMAATAACALLIATSSVQACGDRYPCASRMLQHRVFVRHVRHLHRHYAMHGRAYRKIARAMQASRPIYSGHLVTVPTVAGVPITVNAGIVDRMTSFIADLVAHGYKPRHIGCYARGGHVHNSRHYSGNACDFDGSLSVAPFLRTALAAELIKKHGLHNGCDYVLHGIRDCGHIDDQVGFHHGMGRAYAFYQPHRHYYHHYR